MPGQHAEIAGHVPVHSVKKLIQRTVGPGGIIKAEQAGSHHIHMRAARLKADGGDPAVAGHEGGDPLPKEGRKIRERILFDGKPVVVRVPVYEARRQGFASQLEDLIRLVVQSLSVFYDAVVLDQYVAKKGCAACPVVDPGVLQKLFHASRLLCFLS